MVNNSSVSAIKRAQKESLLLREISQLFLSISIDDPRVQNLTVNRVKLSSDKSVCSIFFYTPLGKEAFDELAGTLILYKPSIRRALAQRIAGRYTPNLVFKYDASFEKQQQLEKLLDSIDTEEPLS